VRTAALREYYTTFDPVAYRSAASPMLEGVGESIGGRDVNDESQTSKQERETYQVSVGDADLRFRAFGSRRFYPKRLRKSTFVERETAIYHCGT